MYVMAGVGYDATAFGLGFVSGWVAGGRRLAQRCSAPGQSRVLVLVPRKGGAWLGVGLRLRFWGKRKAGEKGSFWRREVGRRSSSSSTSSRKRKRTSKKK